jgi:nucleoside 2-deoxyribosyltransferase
VDFFNGREGIVKDITRNIYLAGPIFDCDDRDVFLWRNHASAILEDRGWNVVDPAISEDFRGRERGIEKQIVKHDMELMETCDFMLANCGRASHGTAMEIFHFFTRGLGRIVVVSRNPGPWLVAHSHAVVGSVDEAIELLAGWYP